MNRIAVTGARGRLGTELVTALAAEGFEAVALDRGGEWEGPIRSADGIVHLAGGLHTRRGESQVQRNVDVTRKVAEALVGSSVSRSVMISYVGASTDSSNLFLRTKAEAENLLLGSGVSTTVFRCTQMYGPPDNPGPLFESLLSKGGKPVSILGDGSQRIAVLYTGDVCRAILAALRPGAATGVFDLEGPDELSLEALTKRLNSPGVKIRKIRGGMARLLGHVVPALSPELVSVMLAGSVGPDTARTLDEFSLQRRHLDDVWPKSTRAGSP